MSRIVLEANGGEKTVVWNISLPLAPEGKRERAFEGEGARGRLNNIIRTYVELYEEMPENLTKTTHASQTFDVVSVE